MIDIEPVRRSNRSLTLRLVLLAVGMFGFGFMLVPFYYLLCKVTGIGARVPEVAAAPQAVAAEIAPRRVTVEFVASVNAYAPWEFRPETPKLEVQPGQLYDVKFFARNLTARHLTGQAVPSIAPAEGAKFFRKTECFCFRAQEFEPSESRDLAVQFYLDPALPAYVDRVTLSYTMFVKPESAAKIGVRLDFSNPSVPASGAAEEKSSLTPISPTPIAGSPRARS